LILLGSLLSEQDMLSALGNYLNDTLGLGKTLEFIYEGLVNLGEVEFLLPIG